MPTEMTARETETRTRASLAKTMTCKDHPTEGVVHYRAVYGSFECHVYRERTLFTHVVSYA